MSSEARPPWLPVTSSTTPPSAAPASASPEAASHPPLAHSPSTDIDDGAAASTAPWSPPAGMSPPVAPIQRRPLTSSPYLSRVEPELEVPSEPIALGTPIHKEDVAVPAVLTPHVSEAPATSWDAVRELGQAAVVAASLDKPVTSAAVASATLPHANSNTALHDFGTVPAFVPTFATDQAPLNPLPATTPEKPFAPVFTEEPAAVSAHEPLPHETPASVFPRVELPPQQPTQIVATDVTTLTPAEGGKGGASGEPPAPRTPWYRKRVLWIVIGLAILAGLAVLAARLIAIANPEVLPTPVVTAPVATPTVAPIDVSDGSELMQSMPREVWTYVLTSATPQPLDDTLPTRTAEHLTLAYGASTGDAHFTVEVYQHFTEENAIIAYDHWSAGVADVAPVEAGGTVVGERALQTGSPERVIWRNGSLVFVLEGPSGETEQFFSFFGM